MWLRILRHETNMDEIRNLIEAQTIFGISGIISFCLVAIASVKACRSGKPVSIYLGLVTSLPVLFGVLAALVHLHRASAVVEFPRIDITNPDAAIRLSCELLGSGFLGSLILIVLLIIPSLKRRACESQKGGAIGES